MLLVVNFVCGMYLGNSTFLFDYDSDLQKIKLLFLQKYVETLKGFRTIADRTDYYS